MANVFNAAKAGIMDGTIDMDADVFECMLFTTAPDSLTTALLNLATVALVEADAAFTEATDATYQANGDTGRVTLGATTITQDDANDRAEADAADVVWTALDNETMDGFLIYQVVGATGPTGDATHVPIAYYDISGDLVTNGGNVTIQFDAQGFLHLTE